MEILNYSTVLIFIFSLTILANKRFRRSIQWCATVIYISFINFTCPIFWEFPIVKLNETIISNGFGTSLNYIAYNVISYCIG